MRKICLLLLLLTACRQPEVKNKGPEVPAGEEIDYVLRRSDPDVQERYADVLEHPWVKAQPFVSEVSEEMIEDIRSMREGHQILTEVREEAGVPTPSFEEETIDWVDRLASLQATLDPLNLRFPLDCYSVMNIPDPSPGIYHPPAPFHIYRRCYLGDSELGFPLYIDVRVFEGEEVQEEVVQWHYDLLKGDVFETYEVEGGIVAKGLGNRDADVCDPGHGLSRYDRAIFFAALPQHDRLVVLYADGPREDLEPHWKLFKRCVNRPLEGIPKSGCRDCE